MPTVSRILIVLTLLTLAKTYGQSCKSDISEKGLNECDTLYYFIDSIDSIITDWSEWNNLWQTWKNCSYVTDPNQHGWCMSHKSEFCDCVKILSTTTDIQLNTTCALSTLLSTSCTTSGNNDETSTIGTTSSYIYINQSDMATTHPNNIIINKKVVQVHMLSAAMICILVLACLAFSLVVWAITVCVLKGKIICCSSCTQRYNPLSDNDDVIDLGNISGTRLSRTRSVSQVEGIGTTGQGVTGHIGHNGHTSPNTSNISNIHHMGHVRHMTTMRSGPAGSGIGGSGIGGSGGTIAAFGGGGGYGHVGMIGVTARSAHGTMHRIQESTASESATSVQDDE